MTEPTRIVVTITGGEDWLRGFMRDTIDRLSWKRSLETLNGRLQRGEVSQSDYTQELIYLLRHLPGGTVERIARGMQRSLLIVRRLERQERLYRWAFGG